MDTLTTLVLAAAALGTSVLSGVFGMAGGLILMGVLLLLLPVPAAMTLHAVTQITANASRLVVWRAHVHWAVVPGYLAGAGLVFAVMAAVRFSPPKPWIYLLLGLIPFVARLLPSAPDIRRRGAPALVGGLVSVLHLTAGVSGPVLDLFFLRPDLDRRLVVATKALTQVLSHGLKFAYFSLVVPPAARHAVPLGLYIVCAVMAVVGTRLARPLLERFSNEAFQRWSRRLVLAVGVYYLVAAARSLGGA